MGRILLNDLKSNIVLNRIDGSTVNFFIKKFIGSGASCLVYLAEAEDETEHLIKEYYPQNLFLEREANGRLIVPEEKQDKFDEGLNRFKNRCKTQIEIRKNEELKNYTFDTKGYLYGNGTEYIDSVYQSGKSYDTVEEESLVNLIQRITRLTKVVQIYHKKLDLLLLDLKPENIFVRPEKETTDDIILFDFDSITSKHDIMSNHYHSFTKDWAAPEQLLSYKKTHICEATDLFSIGEILFVKIFRRHSTNTERRSFANYTFDPNNKLFKNISPEVFELLTQVFRKTIATDINKRFHTAAELINALDIIKEKAEQTVYIKTTLPSVTAKFIGRTEELKKIDDILKTRNVVFLSGFGGIGKTEIALKYANDKLKKEYDTVSFLSFKKNIQNTFCSDDLNVVGLNESKDEYDDEFFETKFKVFRDLCCEKTLIILDNFDVMNDANLGKFCEELGCKIIITTRNKGICDEYDEIIIEDMGEQKAWDLFCQYNQSDYSSEETNALNSIFKQINYHTMLVVLIAKHLKLSDQLPSFMKEKLQEKTGVTSINESDMNQKKDKKIISDTVIGHLLKLFNLSNFSEVQLEILRSLSSLGFVRINKNFFLELLSLENAQTELNKLVELGWIYFDGLANKIHLHQIILDLIYNEKNPNTENCPHLTTGIIDLLEQQTNSYTEKRKQHRLAEAFFERIKGNNVLYADFIISFYKNVSHKIDLQIAEQIYSSEKEDAKRLFAIYSLMLNEYNSDQENIESIFAEIICPILELTEKAKNLCLQQIEIEPEWAIKSLIKLAFLLDSIFSSITMVSFPEEECKDILDYAASILYNTKNYVTEVDLPNNTKINLLHNIMDFFSGTDYTSLYRSENYMDSEFILECEQIIDSLREKEAGIIYVGGNSYESLAFEEHLNGNSKKAIKLYKKALSETIYSKSDIYTDIAKVYFDIHNHYQWIKYLKLAFEDHINQNNFSSYKCIDLIDAYIMLKKPRKAKMYCEHLISYWENNEDQEKYFWLVVGFSKSYLTTTNVSKKKEFLQNCVETLKKLSTEKICNSELCDFWLILLQNAINAENHTDFKKVLSVVEKAENKIPEKIYNFIADCDSSFIPTENRIQAIIYLCSTTYDENKKLEFCQKAMLLYKDKEVQNEYLYNCIIEQFASCYEYNDLYHYDEICNHYLLAKKRSEGKTPEECIELWSKAANNYIWCNNSNYNDALKCYKEYFSLVADLKKTVSVNKAKNIVLAAEWRMMCYYHLKNQGEMKEWANKCLKAISPILYSNAYETILAKYTDANMNFAKKMQDLKNLKNALVLYFITVIIQNQSFGEQLSILDGSIFDDSNFVSIENLFCDCIQNIFPAHQIDDVASCCKYIKELNQETAVAEKTLNCIEMFFKQQINNLLDFE